MRTGTLGVLFGVVYRMTGSVWAPMLLHLAVDLSSGSMSHRLVGEEPAVNLGARAAV